LRERERERDWVGWVVGLLELFSWVIGKDQGMEEAQVREHGVCHAILATLA